MESEQQPLVVVVGSTASGKSAVALELARRFNGEIIAADSRTVYKGMDIGTAKPPKTELENIPHHLLDIIEPAKAFNAADFKARALEAIADIQQRQKLPIMAGGTGLYIDAVLYDFEFSLPGSERDATNPRHLKRDKKILVGDIRPNTIIIGLKTERDMLERRIVKRTETMFDRGLLEEVKRLVNNYGWEAPGLQAIGYQEFKPFFEGAESLEEVKANIITHTMQYAKRQRTWFKRNKSIHWVEKQIEAVELTTTFLNKNKSL